MDPTCTGVLAVEILMGLGRSHPGVEVMPGLHSLPLLPLLPPALPHMMLRVESDPVWATALPQPVEVLGFLHGLWTASQQHD